MWCIPDNNIRVVSFKPQIMLIRQEGQLNLCFEMVMSLKLESKCHVNLLNLWLVLTLQDVNHDISKHQCTFPESHYE